MQSKIKVHLRHRHPVLAAGIAALLAADVEFVAEPQATLVIADLAEALTLPFTTRLLVVESALGAAKLQALLRAGLRACVSADGAPEQLLLSLQALQTNDSYFCPLAAALVPEALNGPEPTGREREVLALLCEGLDNKTIAARLAIAPGTVKCHVKALLAKTGTRSRTALVAGALRCGLGPQRS